MCNMLVAQSCLILCDPINCSRLGSSILGILQARILEWAAIPFSRGSSWPWDQTLVSHTAGDSLPSEPLGKLVCSIFDETFHHQSHSYAYIQRKPLIWKDTRIPMFITALFTTTKTWKQPKCPLTDEGIKM